MRDSFAGLETRRYTADPAWTQIRRYVAGPVSRGDIAGVRTRRPVAVAACVVLLSLTAACGRSEEAPPQPATAVAPQDSPWNAAIRPLEVPVAGQSAYPHLASSSRGVILSWLETVEATATLKFSERTGSGWSPVQTVGSSDEWFVSSADVPTVMRLSDGSLVATTYPATDASIEAYDLRLSYSRDDGRTWSRALSPHHDGTTTQHGFASLFELPGRELGVVWLDGRDQELNKTDPEGGSMGIYYTTFDADWQQSPESAINTRVCECCQTAGAVTDDGPVVAFRDRSPREVRDINVARLEGGQWTQPRPLHVDGWQIDACPVNGPALSARGRNVAAAWFAAPGDEGRAFAAFSSDSGRSWSEPIRLDDGASLGHVDIEMLDDGSAIASWVEFTTQRAQLRLRRVQPSGGRSTPIVLAGTGEGYVSGYPRLARQGNEVVVAWTESDQTGRMSQRVRAAAVPLP